MRYWSAESYYKNPLHLPPLFNNHTHKTLSKTHTSPLLCLCISKHIHTSLSIYLQGLDTYQSAISRLFIQVCVYIYVCIYICFMILAIYNCWFCMYIDRFWWYIHVFYSLWSSGEVKRGFMATLRSSFPSRLRQLLSAQGAMSPSIKLASETVRLLNFVFSFRNCRFYNIGNDCFNWLVEAYGFVFLYMLSVLFLFFVAGMLF